MQIGEDQKDVQCDGHWHHLWSWSDVWTDSWQCQEDACHLHEIQV